MKKKILLLVDVVAPGAPFLRQGCHVSGAGGDFSVPDRMVDIFSLFSFGSDRCILNEGYLLPNII